MVSCGVSVLAPRPFDYTLRWVEHKPPASILIYARVSSVNVDVDECEEVELLL